MAGKLPLYQSIPSLSYSQLKSPNTGLWYDKFCNQWDNAWKLDTCKKTWIDTVCGSQGDRDLLAVHRDRLLARMDALGGAWRIFATSERFVTGLGREHPVENGFAWHHTLGVPYLPGPSVKGLVRAFAEQWAEADAGEVTRIFGPSERKAKPQTGSVIFCDALPLEPVTLECDVMTPHYGPYYSDDSGNTPPADWHDPSPIPLLTVAAGQMFVFALAPRRNHDPQSREDCARAEAWLNEALDAIGAGAKTAVGYGRFGRNQTMEDALREQRAARQREHEQAQQREQELASLPPEVAELARRAHEEHWTTDKGAFLTGVEQYLEATPEPSPRCVAWLRDRFEYWDRGIWDDPDKTRGKKNKPVYKQRQRELVHRLKRLEDQ